MSYPHGAKLSSRASNDLDALDSKEYIPQWIQPMWHGMHVTLLSSWAVKQSYHLLKWAAKHIYHLEAKPGRKKFFFEPKRAVNHTYYYIPKHGSKTCVILILNWKAKQNITMVWTGQQFMGCLDAKLSIIYVVVKMCSEYIHATMMRKLAA